MQNFLASRKIIWIFVAVGIIAIIVIVVASSRTKNQTAQMTQKTAAKPKIEVAKQAVDSSKLPANFPADFPLEAAGAKVTQNYQATTADGRQQSTRVFETSKSLDDSLKIYQDYFKKNGWTVSDTQKGDNYRTILASKNGLLIQVAIAQNKSTQVKTVSVTVIPQATAAPAAAPKK